MRRFALLAVVVLAGCGSSSSSSHHAGVTAPGCHYHGQLPDPRCTPGATNPSVTQANIQQTVCVKGWTSTVRPPVSVTQPLKASLEVAYGVAGPHPHPFSNEELDHLIPLELGGAPADDRNLWPQPAPAYHAKDLVENALRAAVCSGKLKLAAAQQAIAANWQTTTAPPAPGD